MIGEGAFGNSLGRKQFVINGSMNNLTFDYEYRLTSATRGGATTSMSYDDNGRKTQMDDPDMGT
jgi:YD repeat-containing protein